MNRDPPPAVFSSYHFTSFEKSDLIGPGEGEDGWSGNSKGRGLVTHPLSPSSPRLFVPPELFFFEEKDDHDTFRNILKAFRPLFDADLCECFGMGMFAFSKK